MQPKKIAIFGGGMSALTTAYELTNHADWQNNYDITIYQMGWRVGGKTSTGRGKHDTIEEVGIHIFQGWYDNAFKVFQDAYAYNEKNNLFPADFPFKTWKDAFLLENATLLTQWFAPKNEWISKNLILPPNNLTPGQGGQQPVGVLIQKVLYILNEVIFGKTNPENKDNNLSNSILGNVFDNIIGNDHITQANKWYDSLVGDAHKLINNVIGNTLSKIGLNIYRNTPHLFLSKAAELAKDLTTKPAVYQLIIDLLKEFEKWFEYITGLFPKTDERMYWIRTMGEFGLVALRGFLEDIYNPETKKVDFDAINHLDFRQWLKQKGLSEESLQSATVRFIYTGTFANLAGKNGLIAAGTAMNFLSVSINYKGAFVWKFKAGTGDTMVAPIYTMLAHRGVKFKFFHKVTQVHHSTTGEIEQVSIAKQVTLKQEPYKPLIKVKGVPAWTAEPLYDQIDDQQAKKLQEEHINLESAWSNWQNVDNFTLQKGKDFDIAVLAIPVAALGGEQGVCSEIIAKNMKWQAMYKNVKTTSTQSIQTYITPSYTDLGMNLKNWGIEQGATPNLVTYASPIYSWIDMSLVIPQESFSQAGKPNILIYFCGSADDPVVIPPFSNTQYPNEAREQLISRFQQWLNDNMGYFFPKGTSIEYPQGFNFDMFFDMNDSTQATGEEKLLSQTIRININPWDRYTLSVPQSAKYRLKTDASEFKNLFLTGDWIDFGVNVGYIEGAVNSGLQAAQALRKSLELPNNAVNYNEII